MSGRGFGIGTVSPELCQNPREIAAIDHIRRVGLTGDGIGWIAMSIVKVEGPIAVGARKIETVIAGRSGRNVDGHSVIRRQLAAGGNDCHDFVYKLCMGCSPKKWRRSRIDPGLGRIRARQGERPHAEPLCPEIILNGSLGNPFWSTALTICSRCH